MESGAIGTLDLHFLTCERAALPEDPGGSNMNRAFSENRPKYENESPEKSNEDGDLNEGNAADSGQLLRFYVI
jgi:hypothetical protein